MCWLMFMGRGVTQAVRVVLGALMPFIAADLDLDHQRRDRISRLRCGLHVHAGAGGLGRTWHGGRGPILLALGSLGMGAYCIPWSADLFGANGLSACLFVMGLCEGPSYPSMGTLLGRWIPAHERSKAVSISDTGSSFGSMLTFAVAPPLATSLRLAHDDAPLGLRLLIRQPCGTFMPRTAPTSALVPPSEN